jgi:hypothetical protein
LELAQSVLTTIPFVLIKVIAATQPLTVEATTLARNQELEDASDRNATLLVAITPLRLHDVRNLAGEGEHWKSGSQKTIELQQGHTVWLTQGMHRLRNSGPVRHCRMVVVVRRKSRVIGKFNVWRVVVADNPVFRALRRVKFGVVGL